MSALLNIKKNALETNFGEGGVNMPSTSIYSSGWCLFVGADLESIPFYARSYFLGGCSFPPFPRISVSAMQATASTSISFLLFLHVPESSPCQKTHRNTTSKVTFLVKIDLLASGLFLCICLLKKSFHHPSMSGNRWVFPS